MFPTIGSRSQRDRALPQGSWDFVNKCLTLTNPLAAPAKPLLSLNLGAIASNVSALNITGTFNNSGVVFDAPLFMSITNTASAAGTTLVDLQVGGNSKFKVDVNGRVRANPSNTSPYGSAGDPDFALSSNGGLFSVGPSTPCISAGGVSPMGWSPSIGGVAGAACVHYQAVLNFNFNNAGASLYQDAVTTALALVNASSSTSGGIAFRVYNTTDQVGTASAPTNYERGVFDWTTTSNVLTIGTQAGGTGTLRNVAFVANALAVTAGSFGYGTGVGGTITQITSRTTSVTLNKICGAITLFAAAPTVGAWVTFTVSNTTVAATDTVVVSVKSGTNTYVALVSAVAASSFNITFQSVSGTTSDSPVINFAVIKAATS